ncbi:MAG: cation:proton antiporter, partial [Longimicrobiales bacterium]
VTFSSTIVVVKLLDQRGDLDALYGRIAVGVLLVQDVLVLIVLTVLAALGATGEPTAEGFAEPRIWAGGGLAGGLVRTVGGMAALGASAFVAARYVARPFAWLARSFEALFIWSLCWCFLFIIAAEVLGLSVEIGAFIAGVSLAQLPYTRELRRRVQPLVSLFIAVFFVTLGARMQIGAAAQHWLAALVLTVIVLVIKPLTLMSIVPRLGYGERTSVLASITLAQISEFSFVLAGLGLAAGLLDEAALSLVGVVGVLTIGVSSYVIAYSDFLYGLLASSGMLRPFRATHGDEPAVEQPPAGHVIVVGLNALGRRIVHALLDRGEPLVVIDTDPGKLEGIDVTFVLGNASDDAVLDEANIDEAKLLISTLQIEDTNNLLAYRCRELGVPVSIHAFDPALIEDLEQIGVDHMMVSKHDGIRQVAAQLRVAGVIR